MSCNSAPVKNPRAAICSSVSDSIDSACPEFQTSGLVGTRTNRTFWAPGGTRIVSESNVRYQLMFSWSRKYALSL